MSAETADLRGIIKKNTSKGCVSPRYRLEFLTKKLNEAHPVVVADLDRFDRFLASL